MEQSFLLFSSAITIYLVTNFPHKKGSYLFGLFSQVPWLIMSFREGQWGIFILALWYMGCFLRGSLIGRTADSESVRSRFES